MREISVEIGIFQASGREILNSRVGSPARLVSNMSFSSKRRRCSTKGCNPCDRNYENFSSHGVPEDKHLRATWLEAIGRTPSEKSVRVCSRHFAPDAFKPRSEWTERVSLKPGAIPTLFLPKRTAAGRSASPPSSSPEDTTPPLVIARCYSIMLCRRAHRGTLRPSAPLRAGSGPAVAAPWGPQGGRGQRSDPSSSTWDGPRVPARRPARPCGNEENRQCCHDAETMHSRLFVTQ